MEVMSHLNVCPSSCRWKVIDRLGRRLPLERLARPRVKADGHRVECALPLSVYVRAFRDVMAGATLAAALPPSLPSIASMLFVQTGSDGYAFSDVTRRERPKILGNAVCSPMMALIVRSLRVAVPTHEIALLPVAGHMLRSGEQLLRPAPVAA
jgi:hypothetical protein